MCPDYVNCVQGTNKRGKNTKWDRLFRLSFSAVSLCQDLFDEFGVRPCCESVGYTIMTYVPDIGLS